MGKTMDSDFLIYNGSSTEDNNLSIEPVEYAFCKNMESVENKACEECYTLLKHKYNLL